jgi:hypothetical protein
VELFEQKFQYERLSVQKNYGSEVLKSFIGTRFG